MAAIRMDSDERRNAIVKAAVPLFAKNGFAGTTTRQLAEAASISEALLYRHFPTKQALYREILQLGCEGDPALERLAALTPSSATLVHMTRFMVRHFLLKSERECDEVDTRLRLVLCSCFEDGEYARQLFETVFERVYPLFAASVAAAVAAGDVAAGPIAPANSFWFGQHVAMMMAFVLLPGSFCVPYRGSPEELVEEVSWFILRGLGMREAAIAAALGRGAQTPLETATL